MAALAKKVELLANISIVIVVVALLLGTVLVNRHLLSDTRPAPRASQVPRGMNISLSGVDWSGDDQTLLLVFKKGCHFRTESAPFNQRLRTAAAVCG